MSVRMYVHMKQTLRTGDELLSDIMLARKFRRSRHGCYIGFELLTLDRREGNNLHVVFTSQEKAKRWCDARPGKWEVIFLEGHLENLEILGRPIFVIVDPGPDDPGRVMTPDEYWKMPRKRNT